MRRLSLLLVPLLLLAGCGNSDDPDADPSSSPSASTPEPVRTGETPVVTGGFGEQPKIEIPTTRPGNQLVANVLDEGTGATLAADDVLVADYEAWVWHTPGETPTPNPTGPSPAPDGSFDSTFGEGQPASFPLATTSLLQGMYDGLVGKKVGSRVLLVVPPEQGFGADGSSELGVGPDDSIIFVFDLLDDFAGTAAADGTPTGITDPSVPTVADGGDTGPTITIPAGVTPPTTLVTQVLLQGDGATVEAGQLLMVQYRGVLWKDGKEFDSSWSRSQPTSFSIGTGGVIPGWDHGLVGQKVGSRVLLVVPPDEGYGPEGNESGGIAGDDTLVFVIDILGTYGDAT